MVCSENGVQKEEKKGITCGIWSSSGSIAVNPYSSEDIPDVSWYSLSSFCFKYGTTT